MNLEQITGLPNGFPNMYIHTKLRDYKQGYITVIMYLKTPTGRRSTYYQWVKLKKIRGNKKLSLEESYEKAREQCINSAKNAYSYELEKKGYSLGTVYIKSEMWNPTPKPHYQHNLNQ